MRKTNPRYKEWLKRRNITVFKRELKRRILRRRRFAQHPVDLKKSRIKIFDLPENFSLINNFEVVINTFKQIQFEMKEKDFNYDQILLNMKNVNELTVDALMYLLVFIKNAKNAHDRDVKIYGNLPKNVECAKKVKESGFLDYLRTNIVRTDNNDNLKIIAGDEVESSVFKNICDFVHSKLGLDRKDTFELYNSLGEIVGNSFEHAYINNVRWHKWLIFAKYENDYVKIVVLDTGLGIIETMKKRILGDVFFDEKDLLKSALNGENRSETKLLYRNRGLPRLRQNTLNGILKNMTLFSNNVLYKYRESDKIEVYSTTESSLKGTLYYFEFSNNGGKV